jgi:hypothetical protein
MLNKCNLSVIVLNIAEVCAAFAPQFYSNNPCWVGDDEAASVASPKRCGQLTAYEELVAGGTLHLQRANYILQFLHYLSPTNPKLFIYTGTKVQGKYPTHARDLF